MNPALLCKNVVQFVEKESGVQYTALSDFKTGLDTQGRFLAEVDINVSVERLECRLLLGIIRIVRVSMLTNVLLVLICWEESSRYLK